jgi:glutamate racemase
VQKLKIGVFDSGVGGLSVVQAIKKQLPEVEIIFKNDAQHVPYGTRGIDEIYEFTKPILDSLVEDGCRVIIIACNTVTTNMIERLREELPVPLIGMEPMVKPAAAASKSKVIAVCATPRTLASPRYRWLKQEYAPGVTVLEPDCSQWALMVESQLPDRQAIAKIIDYVCDKEADQIVLGCTHYHWIEEIIRDAARGRAAVNQPEEAVIKQLKRVISQLP